MPTRNTLKLLPRTSETRETRGVGFFSDDTAERRSWLLYFLSFNMLVTFLVFSDADLFPARLTPSDVGKVSRHAILAKRDFTFTPDAELLRIKAEEAAARVLPVYSIRRNAWVDLWRTHITWAFRAMEDPVFSGQDDLQRERFNQLARVEVDPITFRVMQEIGFSRFKMLLHTLFTNVLKDRILLPNLDDFFRKHPHGVELIVEAREGMGEGAPSNLRLEPGSRELLDLRRLTTLFQSEIETRFALGEQDKIHEDGRRALLKVALLLINAHLQPAGGKNGLLSPVPRPDLTARRQGEARRGVTPQTLSFQKGDVILSAGSRITLETVKIHNTMTPHWSLRLLAFLGHFILLAIFFLIAIWFSTQKFGGPRARSTDYAITGGLFLLFLLLVRVGWFLFSSLTDAQEPLSFAALFPAAAAGLLIRLLIGTRMTVFFVLAMSLIAAWTIGASVQVALYYFITGLAAASQLDRVEHRNALWRSGLMVSAAGAGITLMYRFIGGSPADAETLWLVGFSVLGGLIIAILLSGLLPVVEHLGGYLTDIKLLELANTENPVLQDFRNKAIGSFQHSQQVAELAFAAARKVGAKALLVKVAALYHDLGKSRNPRYFIENLAGEKNPHDGLKPSMSALIIRNHVKDTREMLEKAGVPATVIEVAASHHGSTLIEYFYNAARSQNPGEEIPEETYRYPGPIPQTREAGILMLSDAVEAAVRSMVKSTVAGPGREPQKFDINTIKKTVLSVIQKKFNDGQLDACELTLRDLRTIADSFVGTLASIYHERISYAVNAPEKPHVPRRSSSSFAVVQDVQDNEAKKDSQPNPAPPRHGRK